ncbi:MAG: hypothetical protein IJ139_01275 [Bacteroidaceae bacterium]|nr:hypothetical protein [Bacteroidaceae bacterium]
MKKTYIQPEVTETSVTLATVTMQTLSDMIKIDEKPITKEEGEVYGSVNERYDEWEEI